MFVSQTNENLQKDSVPSVKRLPYKKHHRRRKYNNKHGHKKHNKKDNSLVFDMSKWAENFTVAATWQLKHQVAYWKARATALEHENSLLHEIIRNNHCIRPGLESDDEMKSDSENNSSNNGASHVIPGNVNLPSSNRFSHDVKVYAKQYDYKKNHSERNTSKLKTNEIESETENDDTVNEIEVDDSEDDVVVSEEYIQYLAANAKYREDAKRERELLKARQEAKEKEENIQEEAIETAEDKQERLKELYGDKWQRISALEMSTMSTFLSECDKTKPVYWPNIPFNFNYS